MNEAQAQCATSGGTVDWHGIDRAKAQQATRNRVIALNRY